MTNPYIQNPLRCSCATAPKIVEKEHGTQYVEIDLKTACGKHLAWAHHDGARLIMPDWVFMQAAL